MVPGRHTFGGMPLVVVPPRSCMVDSHTSLDRRVAVASFVQQHNTLLADASHELELVAWGAVAVGVAVEDEARFLLVVVAVSAKKALPGKRRFEMRYLQHPNLELLMDSCSR